MNKLAALAIGLLLFFGAMLWFLASADWNGFVRSQIEIHGSKLTGETVTVDKVDIKFSEGFGGIYGVSFSNPSKYKQAKAFYLGEVSLDIDMESIGQTPFVLESIALKQPQAFVEFDKNGNNNFKDLLTAINNQIPKSESTSSSKKKKDSKPEPRISINHLELAGVALTVDLSEVNGKTYNIEIPSVQLGAIGGAEGLPASELGMVIGNSLFKAISAAAKKQYKQIMKEKLNKKKQDFLEKLKKKHG
ncbi:hypothetical protein RGQ13_14760 [Thalassotalea psychrophila]|uniref:AsmA domain-containing protein n=1 Tax=Thalassotalea psychrophila TaxID=3065647 RepID=A0ABY9TSG8_9GAMM|nr:hypothetical protein RGQ13_14760 [Colwelliaceae bacterium SQ149]